MWYYCYDVCRVQAIFVSSCFGFLELSCTWQVCVGVCGAEGSRQGGSGGGLQIEKLV